MNRMFLSHLEHLFGVHVIARRSISSEPIIPKSQDSSNFSNQRKTLFEDFSKMHETTKYPTTGFERFTTLPPNIRRKVK